MLAEFKAFLLKTNALALALAVIIGAALGTVVTSLVNDIIMPPIGLILGGLDFSELRWVLQAAAGGDPATEVAIRYGAFVNAVISFAVVAFVVWRISKVVMRDEVAAAAPVETASMQTCPYCREMVAVDATRCRACTSDLVATPVVV
jgi:large conductance mechanosensitive channel